MGSSSPIPSPPRLSLLPPLRPELSVSRSLFGHRRKMEKKETKQERRQTEKEGKRRTTNRKAFERRNRQPHSLHLRVNENKRWVTTEGRHCCRRHYFSPKEEKTGICDWQGRENGYLSLSLSILCLDLCDKTNPRKQML